jgi:UDP-N-acetylglucosamine/UDP-N-acetyl-alpha-D-glucosaminouronate 4-epimerase
MPLEDNIDSASRSSATRPGPNARVMLVTGGGGFIGSHLVEALLDRGYEVRVLDNFTTGRLDRIHRSAELIQGDIREGASIAPSFRGVDCVFHTAALPRVPLSIENPLETHMVNVVGTINVLLAARDARVRRVVFSGSSSVYGDQPHLPLDEEMQPNPLSPYALQKLAGEQYTRLFHGLYGIETLTLRYFNVFGPRMAAEGAYLTVISAFLQARSEGRPLPIYGDGEQTRDFTHVRDVVRANLLAIDSEIADGRPINIGQGRSVSVNWMAERIGGPKIYRPSRAGDVRNTLADHSEAERVLGWRPQVSTEQGTDELIRAAGL